MLNKCFKKHRRSSEPNFQCIVVASNLLTVAMYFEASYAYNVGVGSLQGEYDEIVRS